MVYLGKINSNVTLFSEKLMDFYLSPLMPGGNKKVTHTKTNLQLISFAIVMKLIAVICTESPK